MLKPALLTSIAMSIAMFIAWAAPTAHAQVVISEIMYNPASSEKLPNKVEWVELYNAGDEAVDLTGWYLRDEDGQTGVMPKDTKLEPGKALVLIPAAQTVEEFQKAWGKQITVVRLDDWNDEMRCLANSPSEKNEILQLMNPGDALIDEVNYDDEGDWPTDTVQGRSIYLLPGHFDTTKNDSGESWRLSIKDKNGGYHATKTDTFSEEDLGSPGVVVAEEPDAPNEPADGLGDGSGDGSAG